MFQTWNIFLFLGSISILSSFLVLNLYQSMPVTLKQIYEALLINEIKILPFSSENFSEFINSEANDRRRSENWKRRKVLPHRSPHTKCRASRVSVRFKTSIPNCPASTFVSNDNLHHFLRDSSAKIAICSCLKTRF